MISGTAPVTTLAGLVLPLAYDPYLELTLTQPAAAPLTRPFGTLEGSGLSSGISLVIPAGTNPALAGLTAYHACAVVETVSFAPVAASNARAVLLLP